MSHERKKFGVGLISAALLALWAPSMAAAESGVHVDLNSPAGTEYAIPLAHARQQGGRHTGAGRGSGSGRSDSSGGGSDSRLFGVGLHPPRHRTQATATTKRQGKPMHRAKRVPSR